MLTHTSARYDPILLESGKALQAVWLRQPTGEETGYAFQMGIQTTGEYQGMWMTESVVPLGRRPQNGTEI